MSDDSKSLHGDQHTGKSLVTFAFSLLLEIDSRSDIFHQYLQFEMAGENIEFRREVHNFKDASKRKKKTAKAIYEEFIKDDAKRSINISADCRMRIAEKIIKMDSADKNVFDEAVKEVDQMLVQGPFPRFANKISDIVEATWAKITEKLSPAEVGKILFMNWFMKNPEVMPLFKRDMKKHGEMLIGMIESAVGLLSDLRKLVPKLAKLGSRHLGYGANKRFFETLQEAMLQTLEELLEDRYTPEVKVAWQTTLEMMNGVMIAAMDRAAEMESTASEKSSKAETITKSETFVLVRILHNSPQLFDILEVYYNMDDLACWGALYDFDTTIRTKDKIDSDFDECKITAAKIFNDHIEPGKVKIPSHVKSAVSSKLESAQSNVDLEVVFDPIWEVLESRLEKRPFPIFKEAAGKEIQDTWEKLTDKLSIEKLGKIMFMNFFQQQPEVMPLFKMDISKHGSMLAGLMDMTVKSLASTKELVASLLALGKKHVKYGAQPVWFPSFGKAMIQTFKDCLRDNFTEEAEKSWNMMFLILSGAMITGMEIASEDDGTDVESNGSGGSNRSKDKGSQRTTGSVAEDDLNSTSPSTKHRMMSSNSISSNTNKNRKKSTQRERADGKCTIS